MINDQISCVDSSYYEPRFSRYSDRPGPLNQMGYNGESRGRTPQSNMVTQYTPRSQAYPTIANSYEQQFQFEQNNIPTYTGQYRQGSYPLWSGQALTPYNSPSMELYRPPQMRTMSIDERYRQMYREDPLFSYYGYAGLDRADSCVGANVAPNTTLDIYPISELCVIMFFFVMVVFIAMFCKTAFAQFTETTKATPTNITPSTN